MASVSCNSSSARFCFTQVLDDFLYDRGGYGEDFSSWEFGAFRIPKASEVFMFGFCRLNFLWSICEHFFVFL